MAYAGDQNRLYGDMDTVEHFKYYPGQHQSGTVQQNPNDIYASNTHPGMGSRQSSGHTDELTGSRGSFDNMHPQLHHRYTRHQRHSLFPYDPILDFHLQTDQTPQSWPPYDHPISPGFPAPVQNCLPAFPSTAPYPPPRLSPPTQNTSLNSHSLSLRAVSPVDSSGGAAGGPRLTLAGSLDPTTGIFYRTPEHPRLRTAQACEKCRTRKAKCSGEHPSCKRCTNRGLVCEYAKEGRVRGPNKPKSRSSNANMASSISSSASHSPTILPSPIVSAGPEDPSAIIAHNVRDSDCSASCGRTSSANSSAESEHPESVGLRQAVDNPSSVQSSRRNSLSVALGGQNLNHSSNSLSSLGEQHFISGDTRSVSFPTNEQRGSLNVLSHPSLDDSRRRISATLVDHHASRPRRPDLEPVSSFNSFRHCEGEGEEYMLQRRGLIGEPRRSRMHQYQQKRRYSGDEGRKHQAHIQHCLPLDQVQGVLELPPSLSRSSRSSGLQDPGAVGMLHTSGPGSAVVLGQDNNQFMHQVRSDTLMQHQQTNIHDIRDITRGMHYNLSPPDPSTAVPLMCSTQSQPDFSCSPHLIGVQSPPILHSQSPQTNIRTGSLNSPSPSISLPIMHPEYTQNSLDQKYGNGNIQQQVYSREIGNAYKEEGSYMGNGSSLSQAGDITTLHPDISMGAWFDTRGDGRTVNSGGLDNNHVHRCFDSLGEENKQDSPVDSAYPGNQHGHLDYNHNSGLATSDNFMRMQEENTGSASRREERTGNVQGLVLTYPADLQMS